MKQKLKNIYNALLFKVKYFIWKYSGRNATVKEFFYYEYSKNLIEESVKLITRQQRSNKTIYQDWVWFAGYIPHDWLDRINKKIEEKEAEENKKDG